MMRNQDLENLIRTSHHIIVEYEQIRQTSDRPEERLRAAKQIRSQWTLIEGYLREYVQLNHGPAPSDIVEIAAHFPDLLARLQSNKPTPPAPPKEPPPFTFDVFVSYSPADREWVWQTLLPRLEEAGLRVCLDERDFEIGIPRLVNIERAVDNSRYTLIVMTPAWVNDQWNDLESLLVGTADPAGRKGRLKPCMLKPCEPPRRIAMLDYADLTRPENREMQLKRLITSLKG